MMSLRFFFVPAMAVLALFIVPSTMSFTTPLIKATTSTKGINVCCASPHRRYALWTTLFAAENDGVVELVTEEEAIDQGVSATSTKNKVQAAVAPFLSQGEIAPEALEMDWSDPKQTRVMIYIILSLVPILFLIPLMIGSRDLIPLEILPPVTL